MELAISDRRFSSPAQAKGSQRKTAGRLIPPTITVLVEIGNASSHGLRPGNLHHFWIRSWHTASGSIPMRSRRD
jgi:hypothetical protein